MPWMIHAEKDRGRCAKAAEGVTLSGVQKNTKLHEDITLEIPAANGKQEPKGHRRKRRNLSGKKDRAES